MTKDEAIKHCRNGAIAAWISASMTLLVYVIAYYNGLDGELAYWNDPELVVDAILIAGLGYGIYRKSRAAAVSMFVYFVIARIASTLETGKSAGIGVALIFLYYFGRAIQGAYVYRRLEREENPGLKQHRAWAYILGIPMGIIFLMLLTFAVLQSAGITPGTAVVSGDNIRESTVQKLKDSNIIYQDDEVEYFYSYGLFSPLEGGSVLNKSHVLIYFPDENDEIAVYELPVEDIIEVEQISEGSFFEDGQYKVKTSDPDRWLLLELSTENNGDELFVKALRDKIQRHP